LLQAASLETFGYTLVFLCVDIAEKCYQVVDINTVKICYWNEALRCVPVGRQMLYLNYQLRPRWQFSHIYVSLLWYLEGFVFAEHIRQHGGVDMKSNSMEHNPSWEANSYSASQEIHCPLRNPKVHYCVHKGLLWIWSQKI